MRSPPTAEGSIPEGTGSPDTTSCTLETFPVRFTLYPPFHLGRLPVGRSGRRTESPGFRCVGPSRPSGADSSRRSGSSPTHPWLTYSLSSPRKKEGHRRTYRKISLCSPLVSGTHRDRGAVGPPGVPRRPQKRGLNGPRDPETSLSWYKTLSSPGTVTPSELTLSG